jgi:hypothetical protein
MGTRSITRIHSGNKRSPVYATFYRQMDGYFEGHGADLHEFLNGFTVVNGIGSIKGKTANGMGCLAAQIIAHFKNEMGVGGIYMTFPNDSQEYDYDIFVKNGQLCLEGTKTGSKKVKRFPLTAVLSQSAIQFHAS